MLLLLLHAGADFKLGRDCMRVVLLYTRIRRVEIERTRMEIASTARARREVRQANTRAAANAGQSGRRMGRRAVMHTVLIVRCKVSVARDW